MSAPKPAIPIPRPDCPTCGVKKWKVPPRQTAELKENWLFRCPVCEVIVPVAET
jgi:hypothetical protein